MVNLKEFKREENYIFCNLVSKQTVKVGQTFERSSGGYVYLTMKMFKIVSRGSKDELGMPILIAEHSCDNPLSRPLSGLMPIGLRLAVSQMGQGETAYIWVDSLMAYGDTGLIYGDQSGEEIPPNTDLLYEVRLVRWRPMELVDVSERIGDLSERPRVENMPDVDTRLKAAVEIRRAGNYSGAYTSLRSIINNLSYIKVDPERSPEDEQKRTKVLHCALGEAAHCAMKLGRYPVAVRLTRQMLEMLPDDAQTYCLLGQAYFALGKTTAAANNIRRAHLFDVRNKQYKHLLDEVQQYISLVEDEDTEDFRDDKEDYEEFAENLQIKLEAQRRALMQQISELMNNSDRSDKITLKGGFPQEMLDELYKRLSGKNSSTLEAKMVGKAVEVRFLSKEE